MRTLLWDHLHKEHGLTLLQSEVDEIVRIATQSDEPGANLDTLIAAADKFMLPVDVTIGAATFKRGVKVGTMLRGLKSHAEAQTATPYSADELRAAMNLPPGVRTPADFAIEHAGYLADSVEQYMAARNAHDALEPDTHTTALVASAETLSDHWDGLRSAVYEFRKRADRACPAPTKGAEQPRGCRSADSRVKEALETLQAIALAGEQVGTTQMKLAANSLLTRWSWEDAQSLTRAKKS